MNIGTTQLGDFPIILAPMEDITDPPFRRICKRMGADLMYTEFISSEGLIRDAVKSIQKLDFEEMERPIGVQLFGHDVESMKRAAEMATEAKPDVIDINFGCPVRKVVNKGAGAGMLQNIPQMVKITAAVVKSTPLPVTVKTRLGWDENSKNIVSIAEQLQDVGIQGLTIHGRTRAQLYRGHADWTLIGEVKNNPRMQIPIIGNGDITSAEKALEMKNRYGVDGIMIGRAIIGNPWIFREIKHYLQTGDLLPPPELKERIAVCLEHLDQSIAWKGERRGIYEMRMHYSNYFKGYPNIKPLRAELVNSQTREALLLVLDKIGQLHI